MGHDRLMKMGWQPREAGKIIMRRQADALSFHTGIQDGGTRREEIKQNSETRLKGGEKVTKEEGVASISCVETWFVTTHVPFLCREQTIQNSRQKEVPRWRHMTVGRPAGNGKASRHLRCT